MPRTECGKPRRAPESIGTGPGLNVYGWDLLCWALSGSEVQIGKLTEKLSGEIWAGSGLGGWSAGLGR